MVTFNEVAKESGTDKSRPCTCKCRKFAVAIFVVLIVGIICWHIHHPRRHENLLGLEPGMNCTIQFRRDALALTTSTSPTVDVANGTNVSISGKLLDFDREAILFEYTSFRYIINGESQPQQERCWIPKNSILLIKYEQPENKRTLD